MTTGELRRRLGRSDAVVVGIGSMVGAGVFVVWAPAAAAAGRWMLLGLVIAGAIAFANATSSAQLAASHPESGGTYVYARERLSPFWGHLAGWGFVVGKTASCAAMALSAGAYLWADQATLTATVLVFGVIVVNLGGLERTVRVTVWLLTVTAATLATVALSALFANDSPRSVELQSVEVTPFGVLQSAGLLFFAFAGYARIATLGEEVREPAHTIPWAIPRALLAVLILYLAIGVLTVSVIPVGSLALTTTPLGAVLESSRWSGLGWVIDIGAAIACLGVLLNLIPGISRTLLAMARRREVPSALARVHLERQHPVTAEIAVGGVVLILVNTLTIRSSIAVSGVAVLTYYAITNAAALRLDLDERRWSVWIARLGLVGCLLLVVSLPGEALVGGALVMASGIGYRIMMLRCGSS